MPDAADSALSPPNSTYATAPILAMRGIAAFVALGAAWRILRYASAAPFWSDEAYLNHSLMRMSFHDLLVRPLEYGQVAPLLFVWIQKAVWSSFGGGEYALRAVSIAAALTALVLFAAVARRLLSPTGALLAVGIFACSYRVVRHAAESKPYAVDSAVAVLLIWIANSWLDRPTRVRAILIAALASAALWLSYPAVFVAGAVAATLLLGARANAPPDAARRPRSRSLDACGVSASVGASFAVYYLLYLGPRAAEKSGGWLENYWSGSFPPHTGILDAAWWLLDVHTGRMFGYPAGGAPLGSVLTTAACAAGIVSLARRRVSAALVLLLAPFVLNLLAAALHKYPYGGASRLAMHLAPAICLLAGHGFAALIERIRAHHSRQTVLRGFCAFLVLLALGGAAFDALVGLRSPEQDEHVREAAHDVAAAIGPAPSAYFNRFAADPTPSPEGLRFDPTARYYLERFLPSAPTWLSANMPRRPQWVIVYEHPQHGPTSEYVRMRLKKLNLTPRAESVHLLSTRRGTSLRLFEIGAPTD